MPILICAVNSDSCNVKLDLVCNKSSLDAEIFDMMSESTVAVFSRFSRAVPILTTEFALWNPDLPVVSHLCSHMS